MIKKIKDFKYFYIYKIINLLNGKIYIGQRSTVNEIEKDNYFGSGKIIKQSIKKYGIENFKKETLELCTKENLNEREIFWIKELDARNQKVGYNILLGGECTYTGEDNPFFNHKHSAETIAKLVLARTGTHQSEESNRKNSESNKGRKPTPDQNRVNSESNKGKHSGALSGLFGKTGELNHLYGKKQTEEHIQKSIKSRTGLKRSDETKDKQRSSQLSQPKTACPHCGFESNNKGAMNYWHNDNCKQKPGYIPKEKKPKTEEDKITCPHCGFAGSNAPAMKQHHFENCKKNPTYISKERELITCPHCGVTGFSKSNMGRYHFNNCKQK